MPEAIVNHHYLEKVIDLAEQLPVVATEDIYDARGNKLLAKIGSAMNKPNQQTLLPSRCGLHHLQHDPNVANTVVEDAQSAQADGLHKAVVNLLASKW